MPSMWSTFTARVSNRLARHFCAVPHRWPKNSPMVSFTFDDIPDSAAKVVVTEDNYDELLGRAPAEGDVELPVGVIRQRPPAYSAVKVGGRRAYALARQGLEVDLSEAVLAKIAKNAVKYPVARYRGRYRVDPD